MRGRGKVYKSLSRAREQPAAATALEERPQARPQAALGLQGSKLLHKLSWHLPGVRREGKTNKQATSQSLPSAGAGIRHRHQELKESKKPNLPRNQGLLLTDLMWAL